MRAINLKRNYSLPLTTLSAFLFILISSSMVTAATSGLIGFNGKPEIIKAYSGKGKWLVVMLWASDCHVCNQEAHQYVAFHKKHANIDAEVLGVSLDGDKKRKAAESFAKKHALNFTNLLGEPEQVISMYENLTGSSWVGTPSFMVYNPKGELLGAQAGAVPTEIIESFIAEESKSTAP